MKCSNCNDPCCRCRQIYDYTNSNKKIKIDKAPSLLPTLIPPPVSTGRGVVDQVQTPVSKEEVTTARGVVDQIPITVPKEEPVDINEWPIDVESWFKPETTDAYEDYVNNISIPSKPRAPITTRSSRTPVFSVLEHSGAERMDLATDRSMLVPSVHHQGPDPDWVLNNLPAMEWDGVPIDVAGKTPTELCMLLFNGPYAMMGLRQRYYALMPFADPTRPTIAEIDDWNIEVIRHLRNVIGNTTPLEGDDRLYLEAHWGDERRFSRVWDAAYPGTNGTAFGPCASGNNQHCGATFVPSFIDQAPYLANYPGLEPFTFVNGGAEGIGAVNTDLPWGMKLVPRLYNWICNEGFAGHGGPLVSRTKVGMSFYTSITNGVATNNGTTLRMKWL